MDLNYKRNAKKIGYHLLPVLSFFINPFYMNINQRIKFSCLIMTIIWWATDFVKKEWACAFLLIIFVVFGKSTPYNVFKFAFTSNFYLILLTFMLAAGINNSKITDKLASYMIKCFGDIPKKMVLISFILGAVLIFFIPQPFSRVIILASIFDTFLGTNLNRNNSKEILLFSIFVSSTTTSMLFLNGDIILNYTAIQLGGIHLSYLEWLKLMFLPSLLTNVLVFMAFIGMFNSELSSHYSAKNDLNKRTAKVKLSLNFRKMNRAELAASIIMILVVVLWLTEGLHGLNAAITAFIGVVAMFGFRILKPKDIKKVNIGLLLFLTTAFSIGTVLKESGISSLIFSSVLSFMPRSNSFLYLMAIVLIIMLLHMFIGSSITTLSVAIPSLIQMTSEVLNPIIVVLISYVAVNIHYILPFQHVTIMIGAANKFYSDKIVVRFGLLMTLVTITSIFLFYIPWWSFMGITK